jgi:hypothetical protein
MYPGRSPTPKTLSRKLREAQDALAAGRLIVVDYHRHVVDDLDKLGVDEQTYWSLLPRLVAVAIQAGGQPCYAGRYPADRVNKHPGFNTLEMWAFKVSLPEFPFLIYFKFCLKEHPKTKELHYCHVDCHPDKEQG